MCTLGNIYHCAAMDCHTAGDDVSSDEFLKQALGWFRKADAEHDPWADFGLAEAAAALGDEELADPLFEGQVRNAAEAEFLERVDARPRARARAIQLICSVRLREDPKEIRAALHHALDVARQVDGRLFLYSPMSRRNVSVDEFRADLRELARSAGALDE